MFYIDIMNDNKEVLFKLIKNQRQNLGLDKKLTFTDLNRISYNLPDDIFCDDKCVIWNGYVTNLNSKTKNCYISFFYKNKKVALHRLLYINYVDDLNDNEYLKYTCNNKGKCCTLKHMKRVINETEQEIKTEQDMKKVINEDIKTEENNKDSKNRVSF